MTEWKQPGLEAEPADPGSLYRGWGEAPVIRNGKDTEDSLFVRLCPQTGEAPRIERIRYHGWVAQSSAIALSGYRDSDSPEGIVKDWNGHVRHLLDIDRLQRLTRDMA